MSDKDALAYMALTSARRGADGWWRANCPFCLTETGSPDKRQSWACMGLNGFYHCFRCSTRGRVRNVPEAILLATPTEARPEVEAFDPPLGFTRLGDDCSISLRPARRYLARRGISRCTVKEARVGACIEGSWAYRVIVPVLVDGVCRGYVGRDWTNKQELRYRYPPGMHRDVLFNQAAVFEETSEPLLLVEGIFDALPYWPRAVAFLGKPTAAHKSVLCNARRPLVVVLDGDAWEEGWAYALELQVYGLEATSIRLPPKTDPNDVDRNWLLNQV